MARAGVRTSWMLLATLATGCGGMVVMVNGEPRRIGGKRGAARGGGGGPELPADFSPNPHTIEVSLSRTQFDTLGLSAHGLGRCGSTGETTPKPAASFRLAQSLDDLELRHHGNQIVSRGALVRPDGEVECFEGRQIVDLGTWPEGTYAYHPISDHSSQEPGQTRLVLTAPGRAQQEARARLRDELRPEPGLNPSYAKARPGPGPAIQAAHLDMGSCIDKQAQSSTFLAPIARLVVERPSTFAIEVAGAKRSDVHIRLAEGTCQRMDMKDDGPARGGVALPAGTHEIWIKTPAESPPPGSWEVAVLDAEASYALGEAPVHTLAEATAAATVLSTASAEPSPRGLLCGRGSRSPSFYVRVEQPGEGVAVRALFSEGEVRYSALGPLEAQFDGGARCGSKLAAKGTYAVWVDGEPNADVVTLVGDAGALDPLATVRPVPASPPLAEREYGRYYAYYGQDEGLPMEALFAAVPRQLLVFNARTTKGVPEGSPLLLVDHGPQVSVVATLENRHLELRTADLATKPAGAVQIPASLPPPPDRPKKIDWYYIRKDLKPLTGPVEARMIAEYEKDRSRVFGCIRKYQRKHDPTWNKNYELVDLRTGKTVASKTRKAADRKCGFAKLLTRADKLASAVRRSRVDAQARALAALHNKLD